MLPYGLKLAWFILSLLGLLSCYFTLYIMSILIGSKWLPILFCLAITMLEVPFMLGMHWNLDSFAFPKAFCQAQIIVINLGASLATGVLASFTQATALTVLGKPDKTKSPMNTLDFRPSFLIWVLFMPAAFFAVFVTLALKYDAITPNGQMYCDANNPEWIRFFGYAGNVVIAIPCFFIAVITATSLIRTHLKRQNAYTQEAIAKSNASAAGRPAPHYQLKRTRNANSPPLDSNAAGDRDSFVPTTPNTFLTASQKSSHQNSPMVFKKPVISISETNSDYEMLKTPASVADSLPHMNPQYAVRRPVPAYAPTLSEAHDEAEEDTDHEFYSAKAAAVMGEDNAERLNSHIVSHTRSVNTDGESGFVLPPNLIPAIWRMGLFQIAFFAIEILASLTTIIDLGTHTYPPAVFGTHEVAVLLAAWGPLIVFGHLPSFRAYIFK